MWLWWAYTIGLSLVCPNCIAEGRRWGGFGWLPQPTVPKARGSELITGQKGANQGPIRVHSARAGLPGDRQSEGARLIETARFKGPLSMCLCIDIDTFTTV